MTPLPPPGSEVNTFSEEIGGRIANLFRNRFEGTYYVGAAWDGPSIWIAGETRDSDVADRMMAIARTVRFVAK